MMKSLVVHAARTSLHGESHRDPWAHLAVVLRVPAVAAVGLVIIVPLMAVLSENEGGQKTGRKVLRIVFGRKTG
jgi:hypothetical protein